MSLRATPLRAQIVCGCLVMMSLSLVLAATLLVTISDDYRYAERSHQTLLLYRETLIAANAISAERGPTNTMLGGDFSPDSDVARRLAVFRANSDEALTRITEQVTENGKNELLQAKTELATARLKVDGLLATAFEERRLVAISDAIEGMFKAFDAIHPLINTMALETDGHGESLADQAMIGQSLLEIRDYAGRCGSILAPYIAKRAPITVEDQQRLQQTIGRIRELWELTKPHLERQSSLSASISNVEFTFFGEGMNLVDRLEKQAGTANFSFTTQTMTDAIVPTFAPLEQIRLDYLDFMLEKADQQLHSAWLHFFWVTGLAVLIVLINVVLLIGIQRMIFKPLLRALDQIVRLADERGLDTDLPSTKGGAEIKEVFGALNVLHAKLVERRQLTTQLTLQATTDSLTGLLNRRGFDQMLGALDGAVATKDLALILVDIDKFKRINDTHGHAVGDIVLRLFADIFVSNMRSNDRIARIGGEEFAILIEGTNINGLTRIAESLREAIADEPLSVTPDLTLNVTASFGVAIGRTGRSVDELFQAADRALYAAKSAGRNRICLEEKPARTGHIED